MLVLSRRPGQRILFPHLDVTVQVLQSKGNAVRLGIDAPPHISVQREELAAAPLSGEAARDAERKSNHDKRGQLNTLSMALHVIQKQLQAGLTADAEATLLQAHDILEGLGTRAEKPKPANRLKALLVEDNANEQALLVSYLRLSGFGVETVQDGFEAMRFLDNHGRPDFLLLDMRLPRLAGPEIVASVRKNPQYRDMIIFAVTGSAPEEFNLSTGENGVNAWFQKPLNPMRIVDAMTAAAHRN